MARADEYRRYAAECLALAQRAKTAHDRARLLEMAHAWNVMALKVAQQAQAQDQAQDQAQPDAARDRSPGDGGDC